MAMYHQVNLYMRADQSLPSQGTSPGVCRGHEEQAAARSPGAGRAGQRGQWASHPQSGAVPVLGLHSAPAVPHPRTLAIPRPQDSPPQLSPQAPSIPGAAP